VVEFMRTVPAIMLAPLAVLVLGATVEMKVFLISLATVWPLLVHAAYGIGHVDQVARDSARAFRLRWRERVVFLYLPSALPVIATGLRVAATVALLISIGAEIVTSAPGIGHEILLAQANRASDRAFVYVLLSGVLGVAINLGFGGIERRVLFWHAAQRTRAAV
jgi:ABC-type nitrate/sulfonate/bicarbonate transport system permease component